MMQSGTGTSRLSVAPRKAKRPVARRDAGSASDRNARGMWAAHARHRDWKGWGDALRPCSGRRRPVPSSRGHRRSPLARRRAPTKRTGAEGPGRRELQLHAVASPPRGWSQRRCASYLCQGARAKQFATWSMCAISIFRPQPSDGKRNACAGADRDMIGQARKRPLDIRSPSRSHSTAH
jgi:hypothetical protein